MAGYALTVSLIPPQRRGEGLALVGVVSGVPSVTCLPLGVGWPRTWATGPCSWRAAWLRWPGWPGAVAPAVGTGRGPVHGDPGRDAHPGPNRPALTFSAAAMAVGIVVTFLPLAVARTGVAALALLAQPATAIGGRWLAGRYGDRRGPAVLLAPGVLVAAAGMAMLSLTAVPARSLPGPRCSAPGSASPRTRA